MLRRVIGWSDAGWALLAMFVAALIGKGIGLMRAEVHYRQLVEQIAGEWPAQPPQAREVVDCG